MQKAAAVRAAAAAAASSSAAAAAPISNAPVPQQAARKRPSAPLKAGTSSKKRPHGQSREAAASFLSRGANAPEATTTTTSVPPPPSQPTNAPVPLPSAKSKLAKLALEPSHVLPGAPAAVAAPPPPPAGPIPPVVEDDPAKPAAKAKKRIRVKYAPVPKVTGSTAAAVTPTWPANASPSLYQHFQELTRQAAGGDSAARDHSAAQEMAQAAEPARATACQAEAEKQQEPAGAAQEGGGGAGPPGGAAPALPASAWTLAPTPPEPVPHGASHGASTADPCARVWVRVRPTEESVRPLRQRGERPAAQPARTAPAAGAGAPGSGGCSDVGDVSACTAAAAPREPPPTVLVHTLPLGKAPPAPRVDRCWAPCLAYERAVLLADTAKLPDQQLRPGEKADDPKAGGAPAAYDDAVGQPPPTVCGVSKVAPALTGVGGEPGQPAPAAAGSAPPGAAVGACSMALEAACAPVATSSAPAAPPAATTPAPTELAAVAGGSPSASAGLAELPPHQPKADAQATSVEASAPAAVADSTCMEAALAPARANGKTASPKRKRAAMEGGAAEGVGGVDGRGCPAAQPRRPGSAEAAKCSTACDAEVRAAVADALHAAVAAAAAAAAVGGRSRPSGRCGASGRDRAGVSAAAAASAPEGGNPPADDCARAAEKVSEGSELVRQAAGGATHGPSGNGALPEDKASTAAAARQCGADVAGGSLSAAAAGSEEAGKRSSALPAASEPAVCSGTVAATDVVSAVEAEAGACEAKAAGAAAGAPPLEDATQPVSASPGLLPEGADGEGGVMHMPPGPRPGGDMEAVHASVAGAGVPAQPVDVVPVPQADVAPVGAAAEEGAAASGDAAEVGDDPARTPDAASPGAEAMEAPAGDNEAGATADGKAGRFATSAVEGALNLAEEPVAQRACQDAACAGDEVIPGLALSNGVCTDPHGGTAATASDACEADTVNGRWDVRPRSGAQESEVDASDLASPGAAAEAAAGGDAAASAGVADTKGEHGDGTPIKRRKVSGDPGPGSGQNTEAPTPHASDPASNAGEGHPVKAQPDGGGTSSQFRSCTVPCDGVAAGVSAPQQALAHKGEKPPACAAEGCVVGAAAGGQAVLLKTEVVPEGGIDGAEGQGEARELGPCGVTAGAGGAARGDHAGSEQEGRETAAGVPARTSATPTAMQAPECIAGDREAAAADGVAAAADEAVRASPGVEPGACDAVAACSSHAASDPEGQARPDATASAERADSGEQMCAEGSEAVRLGAGAAVEMTEAAASGAEAAAGEPASVAGAEVILRAAEELDADSGALLSLSSATCVVQTSICCGDSYAVR